VTDGTVELEVVLHLNIQGNLNLENDFLLITLTYDIIFQQLVQDAHDVYYLVIRHTVNFPDFLLTTGTSTPKQRSNVSTCHTASDHNNTGEGGSSGGAGIALAVVYYTRA